MRRRRRIVFPCEPIEFSHNHLVGTAIRPLPLKFCRLKMFGVVLNAFFKKASDARSEAIRSEVFVLEGILDAERKVWLIVFALVKPVCIPFL